MAIPFVILYVSLNVVTLILRDMNRITVQQYNAYAAVSSIVMGSVSACMQWTAAMYIQAAVGALYAWAWWNGGGGDGTRRRLRSLAGRFQGIRRTAPAGAS